jgi:hypothetical protein
MSGIGADFHFDQQGGEGGGDGGRSQPAAPAPSDVNAAMETFMWRENAFEPNLVNPMT